MMTLTAKQVRQILQISKPQLYNLIKTGTLAAFRVGRDWRVTEAALLEFTKGRQN